MPDQRWIVVADSNFLPANGGGEREHLGFLRAVAEAGWLRLLVLPGTEESAIPTYQREFGDIPVIVTKRRLSPVFLAHPTQPYVVASRPAPSWLVPRAQALAPDATGVVVFTYKSRRIGEVLARGLGLPAVLRQHNREGAYHRSLADGTPGPRGWALRWEALRIERDERQVGRAEWLTGTADISAADAQWRVSTGAHNVVHVPPFAMTPGRSPAPGTGTGAATADDGPPRVLFLGALDIATNTDAVAWLTSRVWPLVVERHPDVVLDVVGRGPSDDLRRELAGLPRVELAADVPQVAPYLARAAVAVNPAVTGSGVNIKLIEYMDAAIPLVSTSMATRGLPLEAGQHLRIADDPEAFAQGIVDLLRDRAAARAMASRGQARIREVLDPGTNLALIARMFEAAGAARTG